MAAVEDGGEADTRREGLDDYGVDLVVDDVALCLEVDWVDDLVVSVILVAVEVLGLTAMSCADSTLLASNTLLAALPTNCPATLQRE